MTGPVVAGLGNVACPWLLGAAFYLQAAEFGADVTGDGVVFVNDCNAVYGNDVTVAANTPYDTTCDGNIWTIDHGSVPPRYGESTPK